MKRMISFILVLSMLFGILSMGVFAEETSGNWNQSGAAGNFSQLLSSLINKTNDGLDKNDQTNVTLTVPGMNQAVGTDIVYVMGSGVSKNLLNPLKKTMLALIEEFKGTGAHVKLGIVCFENTTERETVLPLTIITEENIDSVIDKAAAKYVDDKLNEYGIHVNMESALQTAKDMLDADDSVPAERKHMILMSTGYSWTFDDEQGNAATVAGTNYNGNPAWGQMFYIATRNRATGTTYPGQAMRVPFGWSWDKYWTNIKNWVEADGDDYVFTLGYKDADGNFVPTTYEEMYYASAVVNGETVYNNVQKTLAPYTASTYRYGLTIRVPQYVAAASEKALPHFKGIDGKGEPSGASAHAINYERSMYDSYKIFEELREEGTHCYAITTYMGGTKYMGREYFGECFMDMMAGGTAPKYSSSDEGAYFDPIHKEILHSCDVGSKVVDYIGKNENGNFEFIENAEYIKLTVGGVEYTTTKVDNAKHVDEAGEAAKSSYAFTAPGAEEPTFWLDYFYGDGETTERFVWTFGESVSLERKASLTYKLQLTEKQTEAGMYDVPTNNSAILYPKDSNGEDGTPEVFPVPEVEYIVVPDNDYEGTNEHDKSKTATDLYDDRYTDVTLAVPGKVESLATDIVFVIDKSSSDKLSANFANGLFEQLIAVQKTSGASIKVGVVVYYYKGEIALPLTELTEENYDTLLNGLADYTDLSGTNADAGLLLAGQMLLADTKVDPSRKHVILIGDGKNWAFNNNTSLEKDENGNYPGFTEDGFGNPCTILLKKDNQSSAMNYIGTESWIQGQGGSSSYAIPSKFANWDAYWTWVKETAVKDKDRYIFDITGYKTSTPPDATSEEAKNSAVPNTERWDHLLNMDRAIYDTWETYTALQKLGYNCNAYYSYGNVIRSDIGYHLMTMLAGTNDMDFEDIKHDILYSVSKGSKVVDYIGYSDDAEEGYNFDFIDQINGQAKLPVLKVGNKTYITKKLATPVEGATASYTFTNPDGGEATFFMDYYRGNGTTEEHFVWTINEDVSRFAPVSLTYTLDLVERSEIPGVHEDVDTNQKAILYPKDSEGNNGTPEAFEKPKVEYEVDPVSITVTKIWDDGSNQDGLRPESITLRLYDDQGKQVATATLNTADYDGDVWTYEFTGLREYRDGEKIVYTVTEDSDNRYAATVEGFTVTNKYSPEKINITVSKFWDDGNDQDGIRPESVTINLLANGTVVESVEVTEADGWKYTFTDLDRNANGQEIVYTITEDEVEGYETTIDGFNVTNTHDPVLKGEKDAEDKGDHRFEVNIKVPGGDGKDIHNEVILMVDGSYSMDNEWPAMKETINTIGKTVLNGTGKTQLTLMAFGMGDNIVLQHIKDADALAAALGELPGNLLYGRSSTNCEAGFTGVANYIKNHDDTLGEVNVIFISDGKINTDETPANFYDWQNNGWHRFTVEQIVKTAFALECAYIDLAGAEPSNAFKTVFGNANAAEMYEYKNNAYVLKNGAATVDQLIAWANLAWKDAYDYSGLTAGAEYPVSVVERAFVKFDKEHNTHIQDAFYCALIGRKYPNQATRTPAAAEALAAMDEVKALYVVDYDNYTAWMDTGITSEKSVFIQSNGITGLIAALEETLETLSKTPYNNVTVTDYMSKWVILDPVTIRVENADGSVVAEFDAENSPKDADGNYTAYVYKWVGEPLCQDKAPIILDLIPESEYEAGGADVIGNVDGPIYRITWNLKDGPLLRSDAYTLKYEVIANTEEPGFTYDKDLPANGNTYLEYEDEDGDEFKEEIKVPDIIVDEVYTSVDVTKTWDDNNDQDGKRPESITINLFADGEKVASAVVTEADGWKYTFNELPKYKNGVEIVYTITEDAVEGYTTTIDGFNVTNTHETEKTGVSGSKTWDDNNNQDGKRPESITINLLANGQVIDSVVVTEADGWKFSFTDLDKYANGEEIVYTITEDAVDGYTATINGFNVTNSYTPEKTGVSGSKTWDDNNNQDGKRPESITINLLANGQVIDSVVVTEADGWKFSFTDLPKYADGEEIEYTITEDEVAGYTTTIDGFNVTNSYTPEKTGVSGSKTWNDNNNQDGKRPESITINLLANGEKVDSVVVTEADGWKFSFTDLDKYANGEEIVYTITEDAVAGYTATIDGFNVTNTYIPEEVKVNVNKVWDDDDDFDGKRPGSITINLFADGVKIGSKVVTAADGWKVSFENLPKYSNGKEIVYTITEDEVAEYTSTIAGDAANGYTVTNQYLPEIDDQDPPLDDLPDTGDDDPPHTGDSLSNMLIMTLVCALGFVTCLAKRKQEN